MQPSHQLYLELFKEQSNRLNQQCQNFQTEIQSLFHKPNKDNSTRDRLNYLCDNHSTSLNKICVETIIKFETKMPTNHSNTSHSACRPIRETKPQSAFKCHKCDTSFTTKRSLSRHNKSNHYSHSEDDDDYNDMSQDSDSSDLSSSSSLPNSEMCLSDASTSKPRHDHMPLRKPKRPKPPQSDVNTFCSLCDKSLVTRQGLQEHQLTVHSDERPYACDHCDQAFKLRRLLYRHIREKHNGYPFQCKQCNERFKYHSELRHHINDGCDDGSQSQLEDDAMGFDYMDDPNEFECDICHKMLTTSGGLRLHKLTHSNTKEFQCKYCSLYFKLERYLTRHIKRVHDENPWKCDQCTETFRLKPDLIKHQNTVHKKKESDVNNEQELQDVDMNAVAQKEETPILPEPE